MSDKPQYTLVRQLADDIEIRDYAPYLAATTTVAGDKDKASSDGFRILAKFLQGDNSRKERIEMTSPVTLDDDASSTASDESSSDNDSRSRGNETAEGHVMTFMMPHHFSMQTLPVPTDSRIQIVEVPARRIAVITYKGRWTDKLYDEKLKELREKLAKAGVRAVESPAWARYNSPMMPFFLRHNEIWLEVDASNS